MVEMRPASQKRARFDVDLFAMLHAASTGRVILVPLACESGNLHRPTVGVNIYWVAELRGSPHQLTFSRNSRLGLWCVLQRTALPDSREFAFYRLKVHQ
jgi:hypothetical protein